MNNGFKAGIVVAMIACAACGGKNAESNQAEAPKGETAKNTTDVGAKPADSASNASTADTANATPPAGAPAAKEPPPAGSCTKDMYQKYGEAAFLKVNDAIIAKAVAAPTSKVGTSFKKLAKKKTAAARVKKDLAAFLVKVYGGPDTYQGADMETAHAGLKITSDQYDWFIGNVVVPALKENGVSDDDITNCFAPPVTDPTFKASIVAK